MAAGGAQGASHRAGRSVGNHGAGFLGETRLRRRRERPQRHTGGGRQVLPQGRSGRPPQPQLYRQAAAPGPFQPFLRHRGPIRSQGD